MNARSYIEQMSIGLRPAVEHSGSAWTEMVPMRDGVKLKTLFYMPSTPGPWNVLVSRSPYLKNQEIYDYQGKIFSERGYGFICQYCRGTAGSEGEWTPFENEQQDGEDFLKWLEQQSYIKSIALYGYSYVAYTQWVLLDRLTPKVKTAYIVHFGTDRYHQMYSNGLFRHDIYTPWAKDNCSLMPPLPYEKAYEAGLYKPHLEADEAVWGIKLPWYREWISHTDYDAFWKESFWENLKSIPSKINIPIYLGCGWYDHHFDGMMRGYSTLSDFAKQHSKLLIGPWVHMKQPCIESSDTKDAYLTGLHGYEGALKWMDKIFLTSDLPSQEIYAYEINEGWKELSAWPGNTKHHVLYFHDNTLSSTPGQEQCLSYTYDPHDYIDTIGAECMCYAPLKKRGSVLQTIAEGSNRLYLFSDPFVYPFVIKGTIHIHLRVSTDVCDTAFIVKLMEVEEDGKAYNLRTCATTLRYRNDSSTPIPYQPSEIVDCEMNMWDIFWKLKKGSRLCLEITSSSFPEYNIHCNTETPWAMQKEMKIAHQKIWTGGVTGSYIDLPIECEK